MTCSVNVVNPKISLRDLYFRFWACRDFEISHVWQRAVFLTAFLIACFAGYGGFALAVIAKAGCLLDPRIENLIAFGIAFVGLIMSMLWIMMAKGSKMWYENYEEAIKAFSENYGDKAFDEGVADIAGTTMAKIQGWKEPELSDWLWNTKGGRYSVSRINIFIGQLSFLIWMCLCMIHAVIAFELCVGSSFNKTEIVCCLGRNSDIAILLSLIVLCMFWLYAHFQLKGRQAES